MNKLAPYDSQQIPDFFVKKKSQNNVQQKEDICLKLYKEMHEIKKKQNKLSSRRIHDELKECTFVPSIHYMKKVYPCNFEESFNNLNRIDGVKNVVPLIKFLRLTEQNKNNSLNEMNLSQKSISEIQECSFVPKINKTWRRISHNRSLSPKGFEKAINRLNIASKRKNSVKGITQISRKKSHSIPNNNMKKVNSILIEVNLGKDKFF